MGGDVVVHATTFPCYLVDSDAACSYDIKQGIKRHAYVLLIYTKIKRDEVDNFAGLIVYIMNPK